MSQAPLARGTVSHVNSASESGFIDTKDTVKDVMFLSNSVMDGVPEVGENVIFEMVETRDGPRATKLQRA